MPNLRSASSAASSAFSMSFSRFEASDRKRESIDSASFTMSAPKFSGFSVEDPSVALSLLTLSSLVGG